MTKGRCKYVRDKNSAKKVAQALPVKPLALMTVPEVDQFGVKGRLLMLEFFEITFASAWSREFYSSQCQALVFSKKL